MSTIDVPRPEPIAPRDLELLGEALQDALRAALGRHDAGDGGGDGGPIGVSGAVAAALAERSGLCRPSGAFVTIRVGDELRGCIGRIDPRGAPLWRTILEMAVAAATRDDRFEMISPEELGELRAEISVLGPLVEVRAEHRLAGADFFVPGTDGVLLEAPGARGLLLPQVAERGDWSAESFLSEVARKADLAPEAWRDPAVLVWVFRVASVEWPPGAMDAARP